MESTGGNKNSTSLLNQIPWSELTFEAVRSRGPGGQNVNKTNSAVILKFNLLETKAFSSIQKDLLIKKLNNQLTVDGYLMIRSENSRHHIENKKMALKKLDQILLNALKVNKKRVPTRPTFSSQKKRVDSKRIHSQIKTLRKKYSED